MSDKPAINTHVRLFDLVRYMRTDLYSNGLLTDEEYVWLCSEAPLANAKEGGSPSPRRLEDYDEMRARLSDIEKDKARLDWLDTLEVERAAEVIETQSKSVPTVRAAIDAAMEGNK